MYSDICLYLNKHIITPLNIKNKLHTFYTPRASDVVEQIPAHISKKSTS